MAAKQRRKNTYSTIGIASRGTGTRASTKDDIIPLPSDMSLFATGHDVPTSPSSNHGPQGSSTVPSTSSDIDRALHFNFLSYLLCDNMLQFLHSTRLSQS